MKFDCMLSRGAAALVLTAAAAATLTACAPIVLGGAAVSAMVAVDRRTSGAQIEDESIELRGASRLRDALGDRAHINATSYNRQVLLTGEVPTEQAKQQAEQIALKVENVKGVVNELAVMAPTSLMQRSSDTLVTGKVKASIVDDRNLSVSAFKIVTERGIVYLMGLVTSSEADRATQIARHIDGVQKVVRVFEIISEDEARRISTIPTNPPPSAAPARPASSPR
jgi:osmotically-inducible protein OsmY